MGLREILAALRVTWWAPLTGLLIGAVAAVALSLGQPNEYVSTTQLFVSTTQTGSTYDVYSGSLFSQQRAASYASLLTGQRLAERVISDLGLDMSPDALAQEITARVVPDTVLLDVSVTDRSPSRARDIARSIGSQFPTMVSDLETVNGQAASPVKVTVVNAPEAPSSPSSPRPARDASLGAVAGLLLGALAAIARARLDRTVRDADTAASLVGAPVIGTVLRDENLARRHVVDRSQNSRTAEDYRQLRTNLQFLNIDHPPRVIMVTSALPSEGKTTLAINLALALAEAGPSVALVEADLRRPRVTRYLGIVGGVGLTNVLAGAAEFDEVVQTFGTSGLSVLAAGPTPPNPGELLSSAHMSALLAKVRETHDYVIIDAPPLLPVADASGLAPAVDGVLLSVRYGTTKRDQVQQAALTLDRVGAKILGQVLNIVPPSAEIATAYGYGYGYGYEAGKHRQEPGAGGLLPAPFSPQDGDHRGAASSGTTAPHDPRRTTTP
jgi:capsular exopolysaccharide synthesis family protein